MRTAVVGVGELSNLSSFLFKDPGSVLKGGVKVCQRQLVNEVLGPRSSFAILAARTRHLISVAQIQPSRSHLGCQTHQTYCFRTSSEPPPRSPSARTGRYLTWLKCKSASGELLGRPRYPGQTHFRAVHGDQVGHRGERPDQANRDHDGDSHNPCAHLHPLYVALSLPIGARIYFHRPR